MVLRSFPKSCSSLKVLSRRELLFTTLRMLCMRVLPLHQDKQQTRSLQASIFLSHNLHLQETTLVQREKNHTSQLQRTKRETTRKKRLQKTQNTWSMSNSARYRTELMREILNCTWMLILARVAQSEL